MTISFKTILENLPADEREKVKQRAAELIAEEMTLQDLRKAREYTQVRMAELLNMRQENVSRLERRVDLLLSTLQSYVGAMGGELSLIVEFKDRSPVKLSGLTSGGELKDKDPDNF